MNIEKLQDKLKELCPNHTVEVSINRELLDEKLALSISIMLEMQHIEELQKELNKKILEFLK